MKKLAQHPQQIGATFAGPWGDFELLPERAVWWPAQEILLMADLHLGKETTFRQHGLAVPEGATDKSLQRATNLISQYQPARVIILGDLFHARTSLSTRVLSSFAEFLEQSSHVQFTLVKGNHDIHTGTLPTFSNLGVVEPPLTVASVMLAHYPGAPTDDCTLAIAGHLHPAARLRGELGHVGKLPCFALATSNCLILPAFGEFVGNSLVRQIDTNRLWLVMANQTFEVSTQLLKSV